LLAIRGHAKLTPYGKVATARRVLRMPFSISGSVRGDVVTGMKRGHQYAHRQVDG
jgi:hypothetical protein